MMKQFKRLQGMVAATFTPFDTRGETDLAVIGNYADWIARQGIGGVFVCGTTGEFSSLTVDERKAILETWVEKADGRFKVIAHVGSNCQKEAVELAAHAARSGADALGSISPSFFKPATVTDLVAFFAPMAAAAPELPFYYYNMPSMTGVNLPVDRFLVEGRKVIPNLAGTKFTHNNLMEMGACIALDGGSYEVLHGYDEVLMAGVALGAVAGVGSTYNYIPHIYKGIFDAMAAGEVGKARELQLRSIRMVEVIIRYGGGVRGGKAVMKYAGIDCGDCRLPISPFSSKEYAALAEDLKAIDFPRIR